MKAILYVVALLAIGGGIVFSINLKSKFKESQTARLAAVQTEKDTADILRAEQIELANAKEILANKEEQRDLLTQQIAGLKATGAALQREVAAKDEELATQSKESETLAATVAEVGKILEGLGGDVTLENLPARIDEVQNDLKAKQNKLEETNTLISAAEKALSTARAEEDRMHKRLGERSSRIAQNSMQAVVTAVNQDWGFLVIGAGSNSGFSPQTPLLIERNGRMIGRVKPSAVESTQTIAEIDLESLAPGVRIQPGDQVILQTPVSN